MSGIVLAALAIPCITVIVMLAMVLIFSSRMVAKTGDTRCLRDIAVLLRAFRTGTGGMLALVKALGRK